MTDVTEPAAPRWSLSAVPRPALWLGLAGLAPFLGLAVAAHVAPEPWDGEARRSLALYGVVILSFMGGCRWGLASAGLGEGASWWRLSVSVMPAILAWAAMTIGVTAALWASAPALVALFSADVSLTRAGGAPAWWPALRLPLTAGATVCVLAGALA
ncbi:MAG: DUF3429 domain-containing protein [Paracoccaceae bacterium]